MYNLGSRRAENRILMSLGKNKNTKRERDHNTKTHDTQNSSLLRGGHLHRELLLPSPTPRRHPKLTMQRGATVLLSQRQPKRKIKLKRPSDFLLRDTHDDALEPDEFKDAVRRVLQLGSDEISDRDVMAVFEHIDANGSGGVELEELVDFIGADSWKIMQRTSPQPDPELQEMRASLERTRDCSQAEE